MATRSAGRGSSGQMRGEPFYEFRLLGLDQIAGKIVFNALTRHSGQSFKDLIIDLFLDGQPDAEFGMALCQALNVTGNLLPQSASGFKLNVVIVRQGRSQFLWVGLPRRPARSVTSSANR